jgi:hypothetical protein
MRVAVVCESSGRIREEFAARGHDAWSCDLKPTEIPGQHHEGDVFDFLKQSDPFDLMIAHPPCTYLCNSGVRWLYKNGKKQVINAEGDLNWDYERLKKMEDGARFFLYLREVARFRNPHIKMAFENPVPHLHAAIRIGWANQYVQPWWFGDPAFKATGLWLHKLPPLVPTNKLVPPKPGTKEHKEWSIIHRASPGPNRSEDRSRTFPGMAVAMAEQWG